MGVLVKVTTEDMEVFCSMINSSFIELKQCPKCCGIGMAICRQEALHRACSVCVHVTVCRQWEIHRVSMLSRGATATFCVARLHILLSLMLS
jgi:hypothetical protein